MFRHCDQTFFIEDRFVSQYAINRRTEGSTRPRREPPRRWRRYCEKLGLA